MSQPSAAASSSNAQSSSPLSLPPLPTSTRDTALPSLLSHFLLLHAHRATAYTTFHQSFQKFLTRTKEESQTEEREKERKEKERRFLEQQEAKARADKVKAQVASEDGSTGSDNASSTPPPVSALRSIADGNAAAVAASNLSPEVEFQLQCQRTMAEFQQISAAVRQVIATLNSMDESTCNPASTPIFHSPSHYASMLSRLQQYEKSKLEVSVHSQMIQHRHLARANPSKHGHLHEHQHHAHAATDCKGKVIGRIQQQKMKRSNGLSGVAEEEGDEGETHESGDTSAAAAGIDPSDAQELSDNAQPFARHLSALLSHSAFETNSPFLFPPSGTQPSEAVRAGWEAEEQAKEFRKQINQTSTSTSLASTHSHAPSASTLTPLSEQDIEAYESELRSLRAREGELIEQINDICEEIREEVMEWREEMEDEQGEGEGEGDE